MSDQNVKLNRLSKEEAAALIKAIEEVECEEAKQIQRPSATGGIEAGKTDPDASEAA